MNYQDVYTYPAIISFDDDGIGVEFPDFPGCVSAPETINNVMHDATEALELRLYTVERDNEPMPEPTHPLKVKESLEAGQIVILVQVYMPLVRAQMHNRYMQKMCTVPAWLVEEGKREGLNFSQVLQEGLMVKLGHQKRMR